MNMVNPAQPNQNMAANNYQEIKLDSNTSMNITMIPEVNEVSDDENKKDKKP